MEDLAVIAVAVFTRKRGVPAHPEGDLTAVALALEFTIKVVGRRFVRRELSPRVVDSFSHDGTSGACEIDL